MKTSLLKIAAAMLLWLIGILPASAVFRLPKIIGNNMVLQRQQVLPVWGWDNPGQEVHVSFSGQDRKATADASGYWKVALSPLKASAVAAEMTIKGSETAVLKNILVGEVWLGSGQSNMEYTMKSAYAKPKRSADSAALELTANYPRIRIFRVEKVLSSPDVTTTGWNECAGDELGKFSALSYFFARDIQRVIKVPIGMIASSWGGSRIEPWTPVEGYAALPAFKDETAKSPVQISGVAPGKNYMSMIRPLAPFAMRGVLWYQGESNAMIEDGMKYADKMRALVDSWRIAWANPGLSFYSVAIAPYYYTKRNDALKHTPHMEAGFWEAQYESVKIPHTGIITITDLVDNLADIHPPYKWEVGRRLSLLALANNYGFKKIESSGPLFKSMKVVNNRAEVTFNHAKGLKSIDGVALSWFTVAGDDGIFVPANAVIKGEKVIITAEGVMKPTAVRFAWNEAAQPNLFNAAGLPAVPFRTDGLSWRYGQ